MWGGFESATRRYWGGVASWHRVANVCARDQASDSAAEGVLPTSLARRSRRDSALDAVSRGAMPVARRRVAGDLAKAVDARHQLARKGAAALDRACLDDAVADGVDRSADLVRQNVPRPTVTCRTSHVQPAVHGRRITGVHRLARRSSGRPHHLTHPNRPAAGETPMAAATSAQVSSA